jgi:hypothetical protein
MNRRRVAAMGIILLISQVAFADASFQSTSQITGGTMVDQLKSVSFLSKSMNNMFAPTTTLTMVHGNQKAVVSKDSTEIIDLDKETITRIDTAKKTYSVVTFAQMRQAVENMPKQVQQAQAQQAQTKQTQGQQTKPNLKTSFEVSAKNTGVTKVVNGMNAQEQVITMQMHMTDASAPPDQAANTVTYVVTTDAWITSDPPEVKEIQDFDLRMAQKMMAGMDLSSFTTMQGNGNANLTQLFGAQPGSGEAMGQMAKEMAKLKGTHVLEVTRMGGSGSGPGSGAGAAATTPAPTAGTSGGSVVGQAATDTATQTASDESGKLGALGSAFGRSALSSFHKKKPAAPAPAPAATGTPTAAGTSAAAGTQPGSGVVLMEMTMQKSNFSQESVPASSFQVPGGFAKVDSPYDRMGK